MYVCFCGWLEKLMNVFGQLIKVALMRLCTNNIIIKDLKNIAICFNSREHKSFQIQHTYKYYKEYIINILISILPIFDLNIKLSPNY